MATQEVVPAKGGRIYWLDNLRTIMILLVVLYHIGGVYEAAGLWASFWIVDDPDTITWVGIVGIIFDIMVMPTIFLISGYLAPISLETKSEGEFIMGKIKRLLIPWVIAVFTLIPIYKVIFLYSRGLPQDNWLTYFHITNPNSQNWLWFLPVLFVFNLLYLLLRKLNIKVPEISLGWLVTILIIVAMTSSYAIGGWMGFRSWTLTPLIDFENERVLIYLIAFLLGVFLYRRKAFAEKPERKLLYNIVNGLAWVPVTAHIFVRIWPFIINSFDVVATPLYRILWWLTFDLSLLCLLYIMVLSFWQYLDKPGKIWNELSKNSYGVYIIHVILIGVFGTLLLKVDIPAPLKYLSLIVATYIGSNLLVSGWRVLFRKILPGTMKQQVLSG